MTDTDRIIAIYDKQAAALAAQYETAAARGAVDTLRETIPANVTNAVALDIGAGTGRDAEWLASLGYEVVAVEPAEGMRREGLARRKNERIRWLDDRLPGLSQVHRMGLLFDVILLAAVWQHVAPQDRPRAFRKIITLLKPGGLLLVSLRSGPAPPDRPMHAVSLGEVEALALSHGLEIARITDGQDSLGRPGVSWTNVVLRMPDDGSGALPLIRGIILSDQKSSTYKLGLLRALARIAEYAPATAEPASDSDAVIVPLGLVALYWIRLYLPLVRAGLPQMPGNSGPQGLGFASRGFHAVMSLGISPPELRVGAPFGVETGPALTTAIGEAATTISNMPANFIHFPNSDVRVFDVVRARSRRGWGAVVLDLETLGGWGSVRVPGTLWRAMTRMGGWIEPVLISEWARMIRKYAESMGRVLEPGKAETALIWTEPDRDTTFGRAAVTRLFGSGSLECVWSGTNLGPRNIDIDHCLPWSAWPCSDLWNLMPAHKRINQHQKRDRLPSARMLSLSKDRIVNWWERAWLVDPAMELRFYREAAAALPLSGHRDLDEIFSGLDWRRLRLRQDQQVPEWELK